MTIDGLVTSKKNERWIGKYYQDSSDETQNEFTHHIIPGLTKVKDIFLFFNGKIFNEAQLAKQIGIPDFMGEPEELIVRLYQNFKLDFLRKLDGNYSIVLYDSKKHQLILASDKLGIESCYYAVLKNIVYFSKYLSDLQHHIKDSLSPEKINLFLTYPNFP